jgi:ribosomal protein S18
MGARSNKTFKQKPKISKAAAAKKFKKKANPLKGVTYIDYKDVALLRRFISDRGNAREMGLLPYSSSAR